MEENYPEILKINEEYSCHGKICENCSKYFQCSYPRKYNIYARGRADKIKDQMEKIHFKIAVLSGKGGVGKSTVTANLAMALAMRGMKTSVVDTDLHGPCIPKMLGVRGKRLKMGPKGMLPVLGPLGIQIVSTDYLMDEGEAVTWFHDLKRGAIEGFLAHVDYGKQDYLLIDLPPGTGTETINVMRYLPDMDGAVVVTVPSELSQDVARRGIACLNLAGIKVLGVVENMSGYVCSNCGQKTNILQFGGGERLAREMSVPFLGRIPLDERISATSDGGLPFIVETENSLATKSFLEIVDKIQAAVEDTYKPFTKKIPFDFAQDKLYDQTEDESEGKKLPEVLRINVEVGANCLFNCKDCYRYFTCKDPRKTQIFNQGRIDVVRKKMGKVKHKIAVMSGKGGVGKSMVTANLAAAFASKGKKVSVVDSDFYGPSIPKILGVKAKRLKLGPNGISPAIGALGIKVISTAFLMEKNEATTWLDDLKREALEEFLAHVDYGDLDYLLVDLPPGTGGETINLIKYIPDLDGAVVVTVPSEVSQGVAKRGIFTLKTAQVRTLGVIENMSGFVCQGCGSKNDILQWGGGEKLAQEENVPFLGRIPLDERVSSTCDGGLPFIVACPETPAANAFRQIVKEIEKSL